MAKRAKGNRWLGRLTGAWARRRSRASIRTRVLAIVLIPSLALLITGATIAGILVDNGLTARNFSAYLSQTADLAVKFGGVVQAERSASLRVLGGDRQAQTELTSRRDDTTAVLTIMSGAAGTSAKATGINPEAMAAANAKLVELVSRLPVVRQSVDVRASTATEVDDFYTQLSGYVVTGLEDIARTSPDSSSATEEIVSTDLYAVTDSQSRAAGFAAADVAKGVLSPDEKFAHAQRVGGYRSQLDAAVPRLTGTERTRYDALVASPGWQLVTRAENTLATTGTLGVGLADFVTAEQHVSSELLGLWGDHFRYAESLAEDAGTTLLWQSILAGAGVLLLAVAAFLIALRLANALVRRLRTLRTKTLELARETLPSMVRRLNDGEPVDVESEMTVVDDGHDEIGQVAQAFTTAQRTAVDAAAAEAKTRGGINRVFLDIAHRSQVVVHRQLEVLDAAEAKQSDPEHLELLFKLDHLATRARRNAENLLILGGGQPGRKWRKPVALEEIVRSAISETEGFERVSAVRLPEVRVLGAVVADLVHLLAELVDNAISFSPPGAPVAVRGNLVGRGVVVEVEDQGLGIELAERERLNETLHNPPDFQQMALAGERNLGLFVIGQLAQRHGIAVNLLESAYGGVKAIVLIPSKVLDEDDGMTAKQADDERSGAQRGKRRQPEMPFLPQAAEDPVPRPPADTEVPARHWPVEEPSGEPATPRATAGSSFGDTPRPGAKPRAPLPRRRRQAHLVPQLQLEGQENAAAPAARRLRSPEAARNSMASFQRGTRQARGVSGGQNG
ncbi:HAMP domain-containing protein [Amycolatopsis sp. K13G38]|uniref:histidine kinase n=1 Tax=Amycolatopsis acididurans TaxID=2724524 RepID=A0ABX1JAC5_9PSEU|nr:ATP-binding protein [Amycolatopsis acididurans]NKQ56742.1 HAMP domain-containing protein [Amycolatopsis acididurans]